MPEIRPSPQTSSLGICCLASVGGVSIALQFAIEEQPIDPLIWSIEYRWELYNGLQILPSPWFYLSILSQPRRHSILVQGLDLLRTDQIKSLVLTAL